MPSVWPQTHKARPTYVEKIRPITFHFGILIPGATHDRLARLSPNKFSARPRGLFASATEHAARIDLGGRCHHDLAGNLLGLLLSSITAHVGDRFFRAAAAASWALYLASQANRASDTFQVRVFGALGDSNDLDRSNDGLGRDAREYSERGF